MEEGYHVSIGQSVTSSPHDQSSEAPFGRATVRRWESEYPAASIPPPFAAPTVRRSSFRPGQEQADVLSERPPHGRREPIDRHHCGLALPRSLLLLRERLWSSD